MIALGCRKQLTLTQYFSIRFNAVLYDAGCAAKLFNFDSGYSIPRPFLSALGVSCGLVSLSVFGEIASSTAEDAKIAESKSVNPWDDRQPMRIRLSKQSPLYPKQDFCTQNYSPKRLLSLIV